MYQICPEMDRHEPQRAHTLGKWRHKVLDHFLYYVYLWWKLCLVVTDEKGQPASQQPASQPAANYTKHRGLSAHNCWNTIFVPFCGSRCVLWSLSCGALRLKRSQWPFRAESSHRKKVSNTLFHTFDQWFLAKVVELWFLKTLICWFKVRASIRWPRPFYQKLTLRAAKIIVAFSLNTRILNYSPGAIALNTWKMQFYVRICDKILTGLGASNWELKKGPKSRTFQKTSYFTYIN